MEQHNGGGGRPDEPDERGHRKGEDVATGVRDVESPDRQRRCIRELRGQWLPPDQQVEEAREREAAPGFGGPDPVRSVERAANAIQMSAASTFAQTSDRGR